MIPVNMKEFNAAKPSKYHWLRDKPDARDHMFLAPPELAAKLPTSVDLRPYCSPIEDQGNIGSCTANAIAGLIEYRDIKAGKNLNISRLFIYYQERVIEGTVRYDSGAYIRDGIKACYTYGAPLESQWPYTPSKLTVKPTTAAYSDALNRKVTSYQRCADFTAVKTALAANNPVAIGFDVYASFEDAWGYIKHGSAGCGIMPYPSVRSEQLLGGHAVALVGYNDNLTGNGQGYFIARNSWGTSWGDNGYFYMPYQVIQNASMSQDFWTIMAVRNP